MSRSTTTFYNDFLCLKLFYQVMKLQFMTNGHTIAFKSNRCDRDLCYEMTYFPCCLKVSKYIAIPFYTSLSFRNWWDLSKEVLYDLVGWKVTELPAFKVCPVTTNARFTMYIESKHDFRANVQLWTLVTLKSFKLQGHTVPFWKDLINS